MDDQLTRFLSNPIFLTFHQFGKDKNGNILLIDEIQTPDSSRYWFLDSYENRMKYNQEPENIDKEFIRLWYKNNCNPYEDKNIPEPPKELIQELTKKYILLYEKITGNKFKFEDYCVDH